MILKFRDFWPCNLGIMNFLVGLSCSDEILGSIRSNSFLGTLEPDSYLGTVKVFVEEFFIFPNHFVALDLVKYSRIYDILKSGCSKLSAEHVCDLVG